MRQKCLRKLAARCNIPCRAGTVRASLAATPLPNQISNRESRIELPKIGYAANQNCANCVFVCKKKTEKKNGIKGENERKIALAHTRGAPSYTFLAAIFVKHKGAPWNAHNIGSTFLASRSTSAAVVVVVVAGKICQVTAQVAAGERASAVSSFVGF